MVLLLLSLLLAPQDPGNLLGTWDYMGIIGPKDMPFQAVFQGDGTVNGPLNRYWNDYYVYDARPYGGDTIVYVENWECGVDSYRLLGGHIEYMEPFQNGHIVVAQLYGDYQAFEIMDRGILDMKIVVLSDWIGNGVRYHNRYPLCYAVTNTENGGEIGVQKIKVRLNIAYGATVMLSDRYPVSRSYVYNYYFYHDTRVDPTNYSEWELSIS